MPKTSIYDSPYGHPAVVKARAPRRTPEQMAIARSETEARRIQREAEKSAKEEAKAAIDRELEELTEDFAEARSYYDYYMKMGDGPSQSLVRVRDYVNNLKRQASAAKAWADKYEKFKDAVPTNEEILKHLADNQYCTTIKDPGVMATISQCCGCQPITKEYPGNRHYYRDNRICWQYLDADKEPIKVTKTDVPVTEKYVITDGKTQLVMEWANQ